MSPELFPALVRDGIGVAATARIPGAIDFRLTAQAEKGFFVPPGFFEKAFYVGHDVCSPSAAFAMVNPKRHHIKNIDCGSVGVAGNILQAGGHMLDGTGAISFG